ncbi:DUF2268 domain-containing putative Zn-dependent protease [Flavobacteriaceae bacterium TK19130]|nr:DUF2268 domain-containing putative Zn-dependent protease [Thermobacterium salinum]
MVRITVYFMLCLLLFSCGEKHYQQEFESSDISNFWNAYDQIQQTSDTIRQKQLLQQLYLDKASSGLRDLIAVRNYTEQEFFTAMTAYPKFWASIRQHTLTTERYHDDIAVAVQKLKNAYPDLSPAKIYFTVGAFRTNGTINGKNILIGSELALADETTDVSELPEWRQPFYKQYKPLDNLALLCTHEYVHTQQKELVTNLLSMCLYEGIAEFVSCEVTEQPSTVPAIEFGKTNEKKVVEKFVDDLHLMSNNYNWLWGENENELEVRDLGYYIGYEIAERYYRQATDKKQAIKELIELDYTDETAVERIVDASGLLPDTIKNLYAAYESKRPYVSKILEFENGATDVDPNTQTLTVVFSEPLNGIHTGLDYGPLGEEFYPKVDNATRTWAEDNESYSFQVQLAPGKKYQLAIGSNFRLSNGIRLKPYVIEFETKK